VLEICGLVTQRNSDYEMLLDLRDPLTKNMAKLTASPAPTLRLPSA